MISTQMDLDQWIWNGCGTDPDVALLLGTLNSRKLAETYRVQYGKAVDDLDVLPLNALAIVLDQADVNNVDAADMATAFVDVLSEVDTDALLVVLLGWISTLCSDRSPELYLASVMNCMQEGGC